MSAAPPNVLVVAGVDPSGGAGLLADVQAVSALGAHPACVVTALTEQDTRDAYGVLPIEPDWVQRQMTRVLDDMPIACVKLGLLGDAAIADAVLAALEPFPDVPVVVDPVLVASGGGRLAADDLIEAYRGRVAARAILVTPNHDESRALNPDSDSDDPSGSAAPLLAAGARWVLVKGGDAGTPEVVDTLVGRDGEIETFRWPRIPGSHHGSGCTLASAIAAALAQGAELDEAVAAAGHYTWNAIERGFRPGGGQNIPGRMRVEPTV